LNTRSRFAYPDHEENPDSSSLFPVIQKIKAQKNYLEFCKIQIKKNGVSL